MGDRKARRGQEIMIIFLNQAAQPLHQNAAIIIYAVPVRKLKRKFGAVKNHAGNFSLSVSF